MTLRIRWQALLLVGALFAACAACVSLAFGGSRSAGRRQRASRPPVRRTLVSASVDVITPQVEVAPNGEAVAAWARGIRDIVPAARGAETHPAARGATIEVATGRVGTGFSRPQVLARLKTVGNSPVLAEDGEGDAVVAWTDDSGQLV